MLIAKFITVIILSYLIGSIPFGVIIGRKFTGIDVRNFGSGKMGTTNVLRTAGKKAAVITGILDVLKGAIPVILTGLIMKNFYLMVSNVNLGTVAPQVVAAMAAVFGHTFSIFLKFRGGRGVATFFGGLVALCPIAGVFGIEVLIISIGFTRFVSFGSIVGAVATYTILIPLTLLNGFPLVILVYSLLGAIFIIVMHRDNIARLLRGTERKLGDRVKLENPSSTN